VVEATIRLRDDLAAAVMEYLHDHPEAEGIPELAEHLLEEFLASEGYATNYVPLRIPVGPAGSAEASDSIDHDRVFAEAWMKRHAPE
jgi:hypothetical protein